MDIEWRVCYFARFPAEQFLVDLDSRFARFGLLLATFGLLSCSFFDPILVPVERQAFNESFFGH
jgi:hypothetical protein